MPHETLCERPTAFAYGCLWVAARKQFTHTHSKSFEILGHGFLSQRQAHCHTAPAIFPGIFRGNPNGRMRKCILADHFHFPTEIPVQSLHYRGSSTDALHMLILRYRYTSYAPYKTLFFKFTFSNCGRFASKDDLSSSFEY